MQRATPALQAALDAKKRAGPAAGPSLPPELANLPPFMMQIATMRGRDPAKQAQAHYFDDAAELMRKVNEANARALDDGRGADSLWHLLDVPRQQKQPCDECLRDFNIESVYFKQGYGTIGAQILAPHIPGVRAFSSNAQKRCLGCMGRLMK